MNSITEFSSSLIIHQPPSNFLPNSDFMFPQCDDRILFFAFDLLLARQTLIAGNKNPGTKAAGNTIAVISIGLILESSYVSRFSRTSMELTDDAV
jgi:hypothetical protein